MSINETERLHLTWDVVRDSARLGWYAAEVRVVDLFREGVERLLVADERPGVSGLRVDYRNDGAAATLLVDVWPRFRLYDSPNHRGSRG